VTAKMDSKKAAELVGYNRRAVGVMIWPPTIILSIVGAIFWGWISVFIVFVSAILFGSLYSIMQSKNLQKITGRNLNELELLYHDSAIAKGDPIAQHPDKYKAYIDSLPD